MFCTECIYDEILMAEIWKFCWQTEGAFHGLEPVEVAAIPMMKYHREAFHSKEDAQ